MDLKSLSNLVLSALGAFLVGFFSVPLVVGGEVPLKVQLSAGFAAGMTGVINHFRKSPTEPKA